MFLSVVLVYVTFILTFELAFLPDPPLFFKVSEYVTSVFFILDIGYNFNRVYLSSKGALVVKRSSIACKYIKTWFFIDLIASFPFFLITRMGNSSITQSTKTLKILRIMNIVRLFRLIKLIKEFFPETFANKNKKYFVKFKKNSERLAVHSFVVFILCHIFACIFYFVPVTVYPEKNWVVVRGIQDMNPLHLYLFSLHWMIETMITVGYGENAPHK